MPNIRSHTVTWSLGDVARRRREPPSRHAALMGLRFLYRLVRRAFDLVVLRFRVVDEKDIEILVLRHQVAVLPRQVGRPTFDDADRALLAALGRLLPRARWRAFVVQPQTVLVWRRRLVARRWAYPARRSRGRPPTEADLAQLTVRLASENATRGYRRAHGELVGLGVPGRTLYRVAGPPPPWDPTRPTSVRAQLVAVPGRPSQRRSPL